MAFQIAPGALDPVVGRSGGDHYYWRPIVDQLVDADPSLNPRPETSLATSWDVSDPKKVVLNLRKGVQFHDGTPFNAEAVKFNIERLLDPATKATPRAAFTAIDKVDVVDGHIVRFDLTRPWGSVLSTLADRGGAMNSPTAVKARGLTTSSSPSPPAHSRSPNTSPAAMSATCATTSTGAATPPATRCLISTRS